MWLISLKGKLRLQHIQYLDIKEVSKDVRRSKSQPHPKMKSIFATTVAIAEKKNDKATTEKEFAC